MNIQDSLGGVIGKVQIRIIRKLVPPRVNETGDASLDVLGRLVADAIAGLLSEEELLETVATPKALEVLERLGGRPTEAKLAALAVKTGARITVSGTYYRVGGNLRFRARIVRQGDWSYEGRVVDGPQTSVRELIDRVGEQTAIRLMTSARYQFLDPRHLGYLPRLEVWREFRAGDDKFFYAYDFEESSRHFEKCLELDPNYLMPRGPARAISRLHRQAPDRGSSFPERL